MQGKQRFWTYRRGSNSATLARLKNFSTTDTSRKAVRERLSGSSFIEVNSCTGTIRESERFQSLSTFVTIYGIGPSTARNLYDIGLRSINDLERYYDVQPGADIASLEAHLLTPNGEKITANKLPDMSIKVALALREELDTPIPRDEVEQIHRVVMAELDKIQPGCLSMIVGGFVLRILSSNKWLKLKLKI